MHPVRHSILRLGASVGAENNLHLCLDGRVRGSTMQRRRFLKQSLAGSVFFGCGAQTNVREPTALSAEPGGASSEVALVCAPTEPNIEGPFFRARAPFRGSEDAPHEANLIGGGVRGRVMQLRGVVRDGECRPVAGAMIEIWHADDAGAYDNEGFTFRGRLKSSQDGRYGLRTIVPGHYHVGDGFRPAHIHVKLHVPDRPVLTTQLYFPGDPYNDSDPFIRRSLIMRTTKTDEALLAEFDFSA